MTTNTKHDYLVRSLRADESLHVRSWDVNEEKCHSLRSPTTGHYIQVTFSEVPSVPDMMIMRSTNWAAEYEPNGWVRKSKAREMYRKLLDAGFVVKN